jgi:hypothetical protein
VSVTTDHLEDDELVLDYYGELEAQARERVRAHLASCAGCQRADQELRATLRLVDVAPAVEPPPGFEKAMWARLAPQLDTARPRTSVVMARWPPAVAAWSRLAWAGGVAATIAIAFAAGRNWPAPGGAVSPGAARATAAMRERVLDSEVEAHLERSQRVLAELVNIDAPPAVQMASDRARAADLVAAGRVFRRSADDLGDVATSELLGDLERVLLDVANGSLDPSRAEMDDLRARIDDQDLVFRLRVVAMELRRRQGWPGRGGDAAEAGPSPRAASY